MQNLKRVVCCLLTSLLCSFNIQSQTIPKLGVVLNINQDSLVYASGFRLLGESVGNMISPSLSITQFESNLYKIKSAKCKINACNQLFPANLKLVGPLVNDAKTLGYLDTVCYRAKRSGISILILGSGKARELPPGYNNQKAKEEFIILCRKMAKVAKKHRITIVLENLNSIETNFLNTLKEAAEVVTKVDHRSFRLNADIYHMMKENESAQSIVDAGKIIVYCEVAEKENRTLPGMLGDNFKPYFNALKSIGFKGPIMIEGGSNELNKDIPAAYQYLTKQLTEVYSEK
ncbi:MAG: TIM barrel protein [Flavobacterium sp.]|nr:TIM barrel protein [Pedobacter sp.]